MANIIEIAADTSKFVSALNRAKTSTDGLGQSISDVSKNGVPEPESGLEKLVQGIGIYAALKTAATAFYGALEAGGALVDLSGQTGVAIDKLMVLRMAFTQAGLAATDVQPMLAKLQKSVAEAASGSEQARAKFADLGIPFEELQNLSADEQLLKAGEAIRNIQNPAQRSAAAMEIFGRGGAKMLSVFAAGGLADIQENIGNQASLMLQNAGIFDRASDVLGTAGSKIQGLFVGIASEIMPEIIGVIDALNGIDLSYIGQAFGDAISFWINYFKNFGTEGVLIYNTLKLAFQNAINFLSEELRAVLAATAASVKNVFKDEKTRKKEIQDAENSARAKAPLIDTSETESAIERDMQKIESSKQETAKAAREKYASPEEGDSGAGYITKSMKQAANATTLAGMPDISSLQKVGGGSALLAPSQDNSPAYQSVRIQEDIREYIKTLIDVVKQGGQDYQVNPNNGASGLVLTA